MLFSTLLFVGFLAGFLINSTESRRPYLLLLPILIANLALKDGALLVLPLALAVACCRGRHTSLGWAIGLFLVAAVDGILPLVKGTLTVPVAFCTVLACAALFRDRRPWAFAVPGITASACVLAWAASGQSLSDLPAYLKGLLPIAGGYTDAMSVWGPPSDLIEFISFTLLLAFLSYRAGPEHRTIRTLAVLGIAFITFKASFVRHDGHAFIAGTWLGFVGLLVCVADDTGKGSLGLATGLLGWAVIAGSILPADVRTVLTTTWRTLAASSEGIETRITHPGDFYAAYEAQEASLKQSVGLPKLTGTVDIYPTDIGSVLASGLDYHPRPVIQSYSAYTPTLAALNAESLEKSDAPQNILFNVSAIDDRYPNLEDGPSLLRLLSHYDLLPQVGPYAVLKRTSTDYHARVGEELTKGTYAFDTPIPLPAWPSLWATFEFHPLKTGRLLSLAFKRPLLFMDVTFTSGEHKRFRMIDGMAEGFLLSPEIRWADDFVSLATGNEDALNEERVQAISIHQDSVYPFWGRTFDFSLAPLRFEPHEVREP